MNETTPPLPTKPPTARAGPDAPAGESGSEEAERTWLLRTVRYILPAAVVLVGLVIMALGSETDVEGGAGVVSAGLAIYLINWLFRAGASGDREREAEDAARDYFDRHCRWPD